MRRKTFRKWKEKALKDQAVREAYVNEDDDPFIQVAHEILKFRKEARMTQAKLAELVGTSQQAIARIESLDYKGHSLATLKKVAEAFHKKLEVRFVAA